MEAETADTFQHFSSACVWLMALFLWHASKEEAALTTRTGLVGPWHVCSSIFMPHHLPLPGWSLGGGGFLNCRTLHFYPEVQP